MTASHAEDQRAQIQALVYASIDALNEELDALEGLEKSPEARLSGEGASLDSLAIVSFQMILEEKLAEQFGAELILDSSFFESDDATPRTLGDLMDHLLAALEAGKTA